MSKHTKGPWEYKLQKRIESDISSLASFTCGWVQGNTDKEVEANAQLIAAAPKMLEVLEKIVLFDENQRDKHGNKIGASHKDCFCEICEVIKKAKGESTPEEECSHDEVDAMEGCLDCGAPYHEVRNVDPDLEDR